MVVSYAYEQHQKLEENRMRIRREIMRLDPEQRQERLKEMERIFLRNHFLAAKCELVGTLVDIEEDHKLIQSRIRVLDVEEAKTAGECFVVACKLENGKRERFVILPHMLIRYEIL